MNKIWSVFTSPYFVLITDPSIMGSKSRWTPSAETPFPEYPDFSEVANLSISSINIIPYSSTIFNAYFVKSMLEYINFSLS